MNQINRLFNFINGHEDQEIVEWHCIGIKSELTKQRCRRLYAEHEKNDVALFYVHGRFHAIDATCPHSGGPLDKIAEDDIEELGNQQAVCPWHLISFDILTGKSAEGYKVMVYEVKEVDEYIFIKHMEELTLQKRA